jgi:YD repeat-containing protein
VTYSGAQSAGNFNVLKVSWADPSASVVSVVDSNGNTYVSAVGPTETGGSSQSLYYAKNVVAAAAGSNTVTVTFSTPLWYPDLIVAEYAGIDTANPLDLAQAGTGFGTTADSGAMTTTHANDLLVAAGTSNTELTAAGAGFTARAISDGGALLEDRIVTSAGAYTATASNSADSSWVLQFAAFKAASSSGDTQAPIAPTGLTATTASSTQIDLSWTASTDNIGVTGYRIERCAGASCSTFAQISTPTTTTYSDTSLTASTSYSYRVRATDAANNLSSYSSTSSAITQASSDTQAPTTPSGLTATAAASTQINLSWSASTDNVGVTAYLLERCQGSGCSNFTQIASTSSTTYSDTGLALATNYSYRVRATDAANNVSSYSSTANAATHYAGPTTYTYTYDNLGRISHVAGSDGSSIDYQYDANGNVTTINRQ